MGYHHVQHSPIHFMLYALSAFMFGFAWQIRNDVAPSIVVIVAALIMFVLALSFRTLTVTDQDDHLDVRYGPLNLFGTKLAYRDITAVEEGTTSFIDGWGIHFIPFRGWTFNLWGFECAKLTVRKKIIRIGTDDSEALVRFLKQKMNQFEESHKTESSPTVVA